MDWAQTMQTKERRGSNLWDMLIHCQFSIKVCANITNDGCRLDRLWTDTYWAVMLYQFTQAGARPKPDRFCFISVELKSCRKWRCTILTCWACANWQISWRWHVLTCSCVSQQDTDGNVSQLLQLTLQTNAHQQPIESYNLSRNIKQLKCLLLLSGTQ